MSTGLLGIARAIVPTHYDGMHSLMNLLSFQVEPAMTEPTAVELPAIDPQRQTLYYGLIEQLLHCPNGQEPDVLDSHADLLDAGLVQTMTQTAAYFAHNDNPDGAKFLVYVARELARQLGLYPAIVTGES
ncbi:MAG: hypothetical protein VKJ24_09450 [Synechococcales bacterium]|nr:hypothetical protein [Synechococcales bacterium]